MLTKIQTLDARVKPVAFNGLLTRYQYLTSPKDKPALTLAQVRECLENRMPPIATAARLLYPEIHPDKATSKLHGKIKGLQNRKLNSDELKRLSDIILKLRRV